MIEDIELYDDIPDEVEATGIITISYNWRLNVPKNSSIEDVKALVKEFLLEAIADDEYEIDDIIVD